MMVWSKANVIKEHDRRKSGLPSAPLVLEHDNNSVES